MLCACTSKLYRRLDGCGRSDLEKAILTHGGMAAVAKALGWPVKARQRRPNGYWDEVDNVRQEIDAFIQESGLQPGAQLLHTLYNHQFQPSAKVLYCGDGTISRQ